MGIFDSIKKKLKKNIKNSNGLNENYFCGYLRYRFYKKNDLLHGKHIEFFENGNIQQETDYLDGKKNGVCKIYYKSGEIKLEGSFINNSQHGKTISYYKTGQVFRECQMGQGKIIGITQEFFKNGNIKFTSFENKYVFFNDESFKVCEIKLDNLKPIGIWKNYRIDGSTQYEIDFNYDNTNSDEQVAKKTVYTKDGEIYSTKKSTYRILSSHDWSHKYAANRLVAGKDIIIPSPIQGPGGSLTRDRHYENTPITSLGDIIRFLN